MTYPQMDPRRLDLTGSFGLRVAGRDAAEVRIGTAGRWGQRVNEVRNPRGVGFAGTNVASGAHRSNYWSFLWGGTGAATPVTSGDDGIYRTWTAVPTSASNWEVTGSPLATASTEYLSATPGETISVGMSIRLIDVPNTPEMSALPLRLRLRWMNQVTPAGATAVSEVSSTAATTAQIQAEGEHRFTLTATAPADANALRWEIINNSVSAPVGSPLAPQVGSTIWWGKAQLERITDTVPPDDDTFWDGDTPDTPAALHHWTGTPHASTSVRTLAWQPGD